MSVHITKRIDTSQNKGVKFIFYNAPVIDTIEPTVLITPSSNIPIIVTGHNFWNSPDLICSFDAFHVTAKWISQFQIECKTPHVMPRHVNLEISKNLSGREIYNISYYFLTYYLS